MVNILSFNTDKKYLSSEHAFTQLQGLVARDMTRVNDHILKRMESPVSLIPQLAGHLIASGGKRLRPMLTVAAAKLCGYEGERHTKLAACVEFIHTATLLHDDVVDESYIRRGNDTANVVWGNQASVLVGDFLFSRAFELMVEDGSLKILKILSEASATIAEGEVLQLMMANNISTDEDSYMKVIKAKTASLFAAACQVAPVLAECRDEEERALYNYGMNLGIAFQLIDDALDYSAKLRTLGKTIGNDFKEGKLTLPTILAYRRGTADEKEFWQKTMGQKKQSQGDLEKALGILQSHNTLSDTIQRAWHFGAKAKDSLAIFPNNKIHDSLNNIIDFCIDRAY
ncbi:MAG: polyprenyl synthetase family protein [Sphingomonadales bacterium]